MPTAQLERMLTTAREAYREMVFSLVEGESFPDAHVREATLAAGFSMADLERHLARAKGRRYWAVDRRERAQELSGKHSQAAAKVDELGGKIAKLEREFRAAVAPLVRERNETAEKARRLDGEHRLLLMEIPRELRRSLPPGWRAGLQVLELEREEVVKRLPPLLKRRGELQSKLRKGKSLKRRLESAESEQAKVKLKADLMAHKVIQEQFDAVDARYRETQAEAQRLQAEIREYSATMNDWKTVDFSTAAEEAAHAEQAERQETARREGYHRIQSLQVVGG